LKKEGVDFLIKSFSQLKRNNTELWILGDGKDGKGIRNLVNDKRIRMFGYVPHEKIPGYIKESDVCVCPLIQTDDSIIYTSMYCVLKLGEYTAMEKSVLCSDVGDIKKTADGTGIIFYESGNEKEFIEKLEMCLDDPRKTRMPNFLKKEEFKKKLSEIVNFLL
jgi:glycosyltransferase involved in cell wall biosynthesis